MDGSTWRDGLRQALPCIPAGDLPHEWLAYIAPRTPPGSQLSPAMSGSVTASTGSPAGSCSRDLGPLDPARHRRSQIIAVAADTALLRHEMLHDVLYHSGWRAHRTPADSGSNAPEHPSPPFGDRLRPAVLPAGLQAVGSAVVRWIEWRMARWIVTGWFRSRTGE
jgi:hypothetical protein